MKRNGDIISGRGFSTSLMGLFGKIEHISDISLSLNKSISHNPYAPHFLGLDGFTPSFLQKPAKDVQQFFLTGEKSDSLEKSIRFILKLGNSDTQIEKVFWGEVAKYYGVSSQYARVAGPKGRLMSPKKHSNYGGEKGEDDEESETEAPRYEKYVEWVRKNIPRINDKIVKNLGQKELNDLTQHFEYTGKVKKDYYMPFSKDERGEYRDLYEEARLLGISVEELINGR